MFASLTQGHVQNPSFARFAILVEICHINMLALWATLLSYGSER